MKLTTRTINILKNFSEINPSIIIKPGSKLVTISPSRSIYATAQIDETFDRVVGVYDLKRLLNVLSMFKEPEVDLGDHQLQVAGDGMTLSYTYTNPEFIKEPPENFKLPPENTSFQLPAATLQKVLKAAGFLGASDIVLASDGSSVTVRTMDAKNPTSSAYSADLGPNENTFRVVFKTEVLKFLPADYTVTVFPGKIVRFVGDVTYFVAPEEVS